MKTQLRIIIQFLFAFIIVISNAEAQTGTTSFLRDSLDNYVTRSLKNWQVPGLAIAVVKDGKLILEKGWGLQETGKPGKVDENTLFMIGSNTKAFTATLMAMLEQEGYCSLKDPVQKYVPEFNMHDPWVGKEMRLDDILCHRLGFETFQGDFMTFDTDLSTDELIQKFAKLTPTYRFRNTWGYCNFGYAVAGKCIQKMSGKSWEDNLRSRIFGPLDMARTHALAEEMATMDNRCTAHTLEEGKVKVVPYMRIPADQPCAGISSSVHDMSHWVMALLDSGRYQGKQIIPWGAIARTRQPFTVIGNARHRFNNTHFELYGLGWFLQDYEGRELVMHDGGVDGFITSVTLIPEENLAFVILTNTDNNWLPFALRWEILDSYLGLPYRNYSNAFLPNFESGNAQELDRINSLRDSIQKKVSPPLAISSYAGNYESASYGKAILKVEGNALVMTLEHHPGLTAKLNHIGRNRFVCEYSSSLLGTKVFPFVVQGKKVKSFTLSVNEFVEGTTYEFVKN